jgi:hypothetical protein
VMEMWWIWLLYHVVSHRSMSFYMIIVYVYPRVYVCALYQNHGKAMMETWVFPIMDWCCKNWWI